jgi:hypothetical protein
MKLGVSGPKFRTDHIASLWESRIPDIDTLKQRIPGSVLVAIDVESSTQRVREIGLAMLRIGGDAPQFSRNLQFFYDQNEIKVTTIQDYEREMNRSDSDRYGDTVFVKDTDEDASLALYLSALTCTRSWNGYRTCQRDVHCSHRCSRLGWT